MVERAKNRTSLGMKGIHINRIASPAILQKWRDSIDVAKLRNRLQKHALGLLRRPMTATQIRAAELLLQRAIPTVASVSHEVSAPNHTTIDYSKMQGLPHHKVIALASLLKEAGISGESRDADEGGLLISAHDTGHTIESCGQLEGESARTVSRLRYNPAKG